MASRNDLDQTLAKCQTVLAQCLISANQAAQAAASIGSAGLAPLASPLFTGNPRAPTPPAGDASVSLATTAFIANMLGVPGGVATLNSSGQIPAGQLPFTGLVAQGTWNASTNTPTLTSSVGTNGFFYVVSTAGSTNLNGITTWTVGDWALFGGGVWTRVPQVAPPVSNLPLTALAGQASNTIVANVTGGTAAPTAATAAQVTAILPALVGDSGAGGTKGLAPAPASGDAAAGKFLKADGTWAVPPAADLSAYALLAGPAFTGTPTATTQAVDTNSTALATCAFVIGQASAPGDGTPAMDGTAARGSSTHYARANHVHPTDTSRAPLASPTFTGTPAGPTAAPGTNTTQIATCAFVQAAVTGLAPLASPTLTGTPAGPTAAPGTNTTQLATCAFVQAALASVPSIVATPVLWLTSSQTITIPSGATKAKVTLVGGGGVGFNMGGGAAGTLVQLITGLTPGLTLIFTRGAANIGGGDGTATTLASGTQAISTLTAFGGKGDGSGGTTSAGGVGSQTGGSGCAVQDTSGTLAMLFSGGTPYGSGAIASMAGIGGRHASGFGAGGAIGFASWSATSGLGIIEWLP